MRYQLVQDLLDGYAADPVSQVRRDRLKEGGGEVSKKESSVVPASMPYRVFVQTRGPLGATVEAKCAVRGARRSGNDGVDLRKASLLRAQDVSVVGAQVVRRRHTIFPYLLVNP